MYKSKKGKDTGILKERLWEKGSFQIGKRNKEWQYWEEKDARNM